MAGVITASEPSWIAPFAGLSPRRFGKLVTALRREGADAVKRGRPWGLPLEDRVLPVAAYWRTNLTMRQLAPLFGVSKSVVDRTGQGPGHASVESSRGRAPEEEHIPGEPELGKRFTSHPDRHPAARYGQPTRPRTATAR